MPSSGKPAFFASPAKFDAWLARHGGRRQEVVVGYWKVGTGKRSMTWPESVEVALRHGWIDGVRHSLGADSYTIRFTPRKAGSHWSAINLATAGRLVREGRMTPAGAAAFAARREDRVARASYEQRKAARLAPMDVRRFKADAKAWAWFAASAPSYQSACAWWIQSAKRPETRRRRLERVIFHAGKAEPAPQYQWRKAAPARGGEARPSSESL